MAKVKIQGHASGTGILTVTAPNTSTDRTITLPDATGTLLNSDGSAASLTAIPAANITGTLPAISGANLTGFRQQILISDTTLSDTTSVEWSVNSDYIAYRCILNELFVSGTGSELWIGASDDGGSTWLSDNRSVLTNMGAGGNDAWSRRTSHANGMQLAQNPSAVASGVERFTSGEVMIFCDTTQDSYARMTGILTGFESNNEFTMWTLASHCDTNDIDTFRLYCSAGTNGLTSGRFTVYGVKL